MEKTLKIMRKRPGMDWERIEIPNTLEALQNEVGGWIECVYHADGTAYIVNEEGLWLGLPHNFGQYVGTVLWVGLSGEDFASLLV